ncbi:MAG: PfkB family carbohydrate kinase [bacterium]
MSLLVVGSAALDTLETPFGKAEDALGGSAVYFSVASSALTDVRLVAVVGEDFPTEHIETLAGRPIDLTGLERAEGCTFRWSGRYGFDLNQAITLDTQLNVFEKFDPQLPESYADSEFVFLANIHPSLQLKVLEQVPEAEFTGADTMNFWIEGNRAELEEVFRRVDCVTINEAEARQFADEPNLYRAIRRIAELGPSYVVIKRGEYGSLLWHEGEVFFAPAYPLEEVFDPTGAGDSFAGGLFGYLAATGRVDSLAVRQGVVVGSVLASFNVQDFSLKRLLTVDRVQIAERMERFRSMTHVETTGILTTGG